MHFYLTARHFSLTDSIRDHVQRHLVDTVSSHADAHDLNRLEVQLAHGQRDERFSCHVLLQLPGHRDVNITEHNHDLYSAVALVQKRLVTVLTALRERRLTLAHRPRRLGRQRIGRIFRSPG